MEYLLIFAVMLLVVFFGPLKLFFKRKQFFKTSHQLAKKSDPQGVTDLGVCYEFGYGVRKDPDKAKQLFQKAARMGNEIAKGKLIDYRKIPLKKKSSPINMDEIIKIATSKEK